MKRARTAAPSGQADADAERAALRLELESCELELEPDDRAGALSDFLDGGADRLCGSVSWVGMSLQSIHFASDDAGGECDADDDPRVRPPRPLGFFGRLPS